MSDVLFIAGVITGGFALAAALHHLLPTDRSTILPEAGEEE